MLLANTASLSACNVAWDIWEWGRREGELSSLVRDNWEEAEDSVGRVRGEEEVLALLDTLPDLSRSVFMQLDSSCLDKYDLRAKHLPHLEQEKGLSAE